ncbi:RDD family protein [Nitrosococcus watsonii]|uniref:RDD domain containing protein n=1 Tax=Nitrosococcus watsoni (strain C-113) TaxID=105559 RepID=D8K4X3_NITWC|nr:RDD family protein [Nitrosococcus watsonii]ADJ27950.1 RDD domain containing protein [Nitrosococcus watsonii C-113]
MTVWWYAEGGKKSGPIERADLMRLIQAGTIGPKTMLWKKGMESWLSLDEVEELHELKSSLLPPLPSRVSSSITYPVASRWLRFFARTFDLFWETLFLLFLLSFGLGFALAILDTISGEHPGGFVEWLNGPFAWIYNPFSGILFGMFFLLMALILDASVYRFIGNTPGKALLGLKVELLDGSPLSFSQYLGRNFSVWVSGLALGIPFINLATMARQAVRIGRGQPASYDKSPGYRVYAKPLGWQRLLNFVLAFIGLVAVEAVFKRFID